MPPPPAKPDPNMPDKPQPSSKPLPDPSKESSSASEDTIDPDDVDKPADSNSNPPADKNNDSAKPAKGGKNSKNANASAKPDPNAPVYDPYHAAKDVDIGLYYQHKGDLPAAIDRFKEAIHLKPDYARPRLLLAEIYDHEHEYDSALRYYREYLKVLPTASDSKKIQERIDKLSKDTPSQ
jgi:tetratricopeptide (TPR) repeat protein